jgi:quercetin dioxygenase-like cupin family protein
LETEAKQGKSLPATRQQAKKEQSSGMFAKQSDVGHQPVLDGIERKTLVYGDKTLMTEFALRKGAILPRHAHPQEQTGYLVRGRLRLSIGTKEYEAQAGDSWCIPGGVEHGADILEDSVALELFSPVRDDYLPGRA